MDLLVIGGIILLISMLLGHLVSTEYKFGRSLVQEIIKLLLRVLVKVGLVMDKELLYNQLLH